MYSYFIKGDTYPLKEEIKRLKPQKKGFKKWWKYNRDFEAWELNVANTFHTKVFENEVQMFCDENGLILEVLEFTRLRNKSINDFADTKVYFDYFHGKNRKYL